MSLTQGGLLFDAIGVFLIYLFAVGEKTQGALMLESWNPPKLPFRLREALGDAGLGMMLGGFGAQFIAVG